MVIFLQLLIFTVALILRGQYLFGHHLKADETHPRRLNFVATGRSGVNMRHVGISQQSNIPFIIKPERWYHRFLKVLGMASEIRISDAAFDKQYFITTDFPHHLERALGSSQLLTHLRDLFALPVKSLHATSKRMWCVVQPSDHEKSDKYFSKHVEIMDAISECSKKIQGYDIAHGAGNKGIFALLFICVHAALLTLGITGGLTIQADSIDIIDHTAWITKALPVGAALSIAWFLLILAFFQKTSWVCWVFVDFLICGIAGILLSTVFVMRDANIELSQAKPVVYQQPVLSKTCVIQCRKRCGRRCTLRSTYSYKESECSPERRKVNMLEKREQDHVCQARPWFEYSLNVAHWNKRESYAFAPAVDLFDRVRSGMRLDVPVYEGALGLEWVNTKEIQN